MVLLFIFIALQVYRLFKEVKKEVTGSRLTLRLVISYSIMIIVPLMVLYFVSVNFLTKSIESWFNVRVESALESGLNIGQKTLDILRKDVAQNLLPSSMAVHRLLTHLPLQPM